MQANKNKWKNKRGISSLSMLRKCEAKMFIERVQHLLISPLDSAMQVYALQNHTEKSMNVRRFAADLLI